MTKNSNIEYGITKEDVANIAPHVYILVRCYRDNLRKLSIFMGHDEERTKELTSGDTIIGFGMDFRDDDEYDETFLENEGFNVSIIHYICLSKILYPDVLDPWTQLSWLEFMMHKKALDNLFMDSKETKISVDTLIMKRFNVDPLAVPRDYLNQTTKVDEFNAAATMIVDNMDDIKLFDDSFNDYEEYFEYMKIEAIRISNILHEKEFFGTHNPDRFACSMISLRMRIPGIGDPLYKIEGVKGFPDSRDIESIKNFQKVLLGQGRIGPEQQGEQEL